jgi:hypothetical protein
MLHSHIVPFYSHIFKNIRVKIREHSSINPTGQLIITRQIRNNKELELEKLAKKWKGKHEKQIKVPENIL